jgi:hypothetical protein
MAIIIEVPERGKPETTIISSMRFFRVLVSYAKVVVAVV